LRVDRPPSLPPKFGARFERKRLVFKTLTAAKVIFGPIENYNRFAAKFLCALRPYFDNVKTPEQGGEELPARPFARRDVKLNDGSVLRLWGFNSVLVSDVHDDEGLMLVDPAASHFAAAFRPEGRQSGFDHEEHAQHIRVELTVKFLLAELLEGRRARIMYESRRSQ
jgi:hypothetical protein